MRCYFVLILTLSEASDCSGGGVHFAIVLPNGNTLPPTREAGLVQIANSLIDNGMRAPWPNCLNVSHRGARGVA
jgi:hypothetical protein